MNSNSNSNSNAPRPSLGVLHLQEGEKKFQLTRHVPSEDIGFFVKHFWIVSWDLIGQLSYSQEVVPNPCVNMVFERNHSSIYGASRQKFSRLLQGMDQVFGVKFKPGGFYPFVKWPISRLTAGSIPVENVFNAESDQIGSSILSQDDPHKMVKLAESLIRQQLPDQDERIVLINEIIDRVQADRSITKVDQICETFQLNIRKLQRIFSQYVGVSPKWVIKLYRLQNAAEAMDQGQCINWLDLSIELGYYDQSHFI
ncbi:helix-turn-helix domain-containing protein [Paenibacillus sp. J2TS4]|uniref:helix-turn-helix domain-containing protein n=1 Tax=Paenibacillus sp. J2TS4 TaxID=2807194 RepID=UPI001B28B1DC|nr:helix-turn-helix domain-containing protein [Paenibacillus sp. J2TS4]GIP34199.1 AraC family transcriptional regulator [Paenibacillus sp. J2TS4]